MHNRPFDRRKFLKVSAMACGGILFSFDLFSETAKVGQTDTVWKEFVPNAWLKFYHDGRIVFVLDKAEMGQGVITSLAMIVCEELEVQPENLLVEMAPASGDYATPGFGMQITGGSSSVRTSFEPLRKAGAMARDCFIKAAAKRWAISPSMCAVENGVVREKNGSRSLPYSELVNDAASIEPSEPELKPRGEYKLLGTSLPRLDASIKADGSAVFGVDVNIENLAYAYVLRSPTIGGTVKKFDTGATAKIKGVKKIVQISSGVAVVADNFWSAMKASESVVVEWDAGPLAQTSTASIYEGFERALKKSDFKTVFEQGDISKGLASSGNVIEADYHIPYMAHQTMEPMNCTAHVQTERCDVWAPTQAVGLAQDVAAKITGFDRDQVFVHQMFMGGGFGRRLMQDFVADAVEISKLSNLPIKMIMSREDDVKNDYYRPGNLHRLNASVSSAGVLQAWKHDIAGPSILATVIPSWGRAMFPDWVPDAIKDYSARVGGRAMAWLQADDSSVEGAKDLPYAIEHVQVNYTLVDPGVPIGFWRSVGHSYNCFVVESFIDECAAAANKDPFEFRMQLLEKHPRRQKVLSLAAEKFAWSDAKKQKRAVGIAQCFAFGSFAAQAVEIEIENGEIKVKRVVCALDCGYAVNPAGVIAQVESAIIFGLSAALKDAVTISNGQINQSNFHDCRVLRMNEVPAIEVYLVEGEATPQGAGEPAVPPVAPAVANAVFAATGRRLRSLPLALT